MRLQKGFVHFQNRDMREGQTRTWRRGREGAGQREKRRRRESMSGCHQTRPAVRRERTWLAHSGSWARTISERKNVFSFVFVCVSACVCVCVSVCLCLCQSVAVWNSGGGLQRYWRANRSLYLEKGAKDKPNHLTTHSLRSVPQESWNSTASSDKANDWRNRGHVVLDLFSNVKMLKIQEFLWWTSGAKWELYVGLSR